MLISEATTVVQSQAQSQITENMPLTWNNLVSVIVLSIVTGIGLVLQSWWQRRIQRQDKAEVKREVAVAANRVEQKASAAEHNAKESSIKIDQVYAVLNGQGLMGAVKNLETSLDNHSKDDLKMHQLVVARIGGIECLITGKSEVELHGPGGFQLPNSPT